MIIGKIKDGIVLDHITAGRGMEIYKILGLDKLDCTVAMIKNADSVKKGKKDIIKVGQIIDLDFDVLGYIDPGITVNIIRDGELVKREHLTLPERIQNIIKCKKAIRKAFEYQMEGKGFTMVEVLSCCPTNWGLSPTESMKWLEENMIPYYPLGVYKDKGADK